MVSTRYLCLLHCPNSGTLLPKIFSNEKLGYLRYYIIQMNERFDVFLHYLIREYFVSIEFIELRTSFLLFLSFSHAPSVWVPGKFHSAKIPPTKNSTQQ